jgi:hypothetical protein
MRALLRRALGLDGGGGVGFSDVGGGGETVAKGDILIRGGGGLGGDDGDDGV